MNGEQAQFEALFGDTRAPLLGYLTRRAPSEDAADLLAEVYLVAWRRRADLPSGEERRLWLYVVARRLLAEHHRHSLQRTDAEGEAGEPPRRRDGTTTGGTSSCAGLSTRSATWTVNSSPSRPGSG